MPLTLLTDSAQVYLDAVKPRNTYVLYKTASAEKHQTADDTTLKKALIQALNLAIGPDKAYESLNVCRVRINNGYGRLVYKLNVTENPCSAAIFHYHWNYGLDLPLTAD